MMKILLLITIALGMTACAEKKSFYVAPELKSHYDQFISDAAVRGVNLNPDNLEMVVGKIDQPSAEYRILAYCRSGSTPTVVIDSEYMKTAQAHNLEETVTHELGHCILGRGHNNVMGSYFSVAYGQMISNVPGSIMNTYSVSHTLGKYLYTELKEAFLDQLFGLKSSALQDMPQSRTLAKNLGDDEMLVYMSMSTTKGCSSSVSVEKIADELARPSLAIP